MAAGGADELALNFSNKGKPYPPISSDIYRADGCSRFVARQCRDNHASLRGAQRAFALHAEGFLTKSREMIMETQSTMFKTMVLSAAAMACVVLAAPAHAQSGQPIVLTCQWSQNPAVKTNLTIDLAKQSVTEETITPNPGGSPDPIIATASSAITSVTDQAITWLRVQSAPLPDVTGTLNRFTGELRYTASGSLLSMNACQRREKML